MRGQPEAGGGGAEEAGMALHDPGSSLAHEESASNPSVAFHNRTLLAIGAV